MSLRQPVTSLSGGVGAGIGSTTGGNVQLTATVKVLEARFQDIEDQLSAGPNSVDGGTSF
jgi:hypothetical protein